MARKVKDAKRSGAGGFTFNISSEFFNIKRLGMIEKEKAVSLLREGDIILGNEKFLFVYLSLFINKQKGV